MATMDDQGWPVDIALVFAWLSGEERFPRFASGRICFFEFCFGGNLMVQMSLKCY